MSNVYTALSLITLHLPFDSYMTNLHLPFSKTFIVLTFLPSVKPSPVTFSEKIKALSRGPIPFLWTTQAQSSLPSLLGNERSGWIRSYSSACDLVPVSSLLSWIIITTHTFSTVTSFKTDTNPLHFILLSLTFPARLNCVCSLSESLPDPSSVYHYLPAAKSSGLVLTSCYFAFIVITLKLPYHFPDHHQAIHIPPIQCVKFFDKLLLKSKFYQAQTL